MTNHNRLGHYPFKHSVHLTGPVGREFIAFSLPNFRKTRPMSGQLPCDSGELSKSVSRTVSGERMRKSNQVRLFSEGGSFKCWIDHDDSMSRLKLETACIHYDPRYPQEQRQLGVREMTPPSVKSSSADINPPSSISFSEMAANAGVGVKPHDDVSEGAVAAARAKVGNWFGWQGYEGIMPRLRAYPVRERAMEGPTYVVAKVPDMVVDVSE